MNGNQSVGRAARGAGRLQGGAGAGHCESRAYSVRRARGGNSGRDWSLVTRWRHNEFRLAGAIQENGPQSRGGCGRRRSSGCALSPQWLQFSALVRSPPLLNKPAGSPPSQTSQLGGGGSGSAAGVRPGPEPCPGPGGPADRRPAGEAALACAA